MSLVRMPCEYWLPVEVRMIVCANYMRARVDDRADLHERIRIIGDINFLEIFRDSICGCVSRCGLRSYFAQLCIWLPEMRDYFRLPVKDYSYYHIVYDEFPDRDWLDSLLLDLLDIHRNIGSMWMQIHRRNKIE